MGGDTFEKFQLVSNYRPTGDQPQAIQQLEFFKRISAHVRRPFPQ